MSRTPQPTSTQIEAEEFVLPEFNPPPGYRGSIERLRLARLERGLSIAEMSDEVGLTFRLAHEFETLAAPLPFEWLEVWCKVVGVPFEDYLAVYRADEEAYAAAKEREAQAKEAEQQAPCITITEAGEAETPAASSEIVSRGGSILALLRAAFDHIAGRLTTFFSITTGNADKRLGKILSVRILRTRRAAPFCLI